jgi:hypothetical protein
VFVVVSWCPVGSWVVAVRRVCCRVVGVLCASTAQCVPSSYATYHIGGFLISIGDIGCVVDRFRWCRRWAGIVREAWMRSGGVKANSAFVPAKKSRIGWLAYPRAVKF